MATENSILRAGRLILVRPRRAWLMGRIGVSTMLLSSIIRFRPLDSVLRLFSVAARDDGKQLDENASELVTAVDAVLGMNRLVFRRVCWKRAILLHRFLGRAGYATTIVFGVRRPDKDGLAGHAWLERYGAPILESTQPDYIVTYKFPSTQACEIDLRQMD